VLIKHRACCPYYRFDPDARAQQPPEKEESPTQHTSSASATTPHHCTTCLFRKPEDVKARTVYHAERVRAGSEVHILLSHTEHLNVGADGHDENYANLA
jgi:hypothetical protein